MQKERVFSLGFVSLNRNGKRNMPLGLVPFVPILVAIQRVEKRRTAASDAATFPSIFSFPAFLIPLIFQVYLGRKSDPYPYLDFSRLNNDKTTTFLHNTEVCLINLTRKFRKRKRGIVIFPPLPPFFNFFSVKMWWLAGNGRCHDLCFVFFLQFLVCFCFCPRAGYQGESQPSVDPIYAVGPQLLQHGSNAKDQSEWAVMVTLFWPSVNIASPLVQWELCKIMSCTATVTSEAGELQGPCLTRSFHRWAGLFARLGWRLSCGFSFQVQRCCGAHS